ncbi:little elongation complex subunit 1 isoform X3 [Latimeria chalumnae]|nr:PREDICTED: little elongation complex subunit 1 isoform X3 [Latimeria chalumnae]|eukprot:XP_014347362.1 PREDICTED: little elongation complex subunit 1 isoform X3 [Latimeria chalumnae]
MLRQQLEQLLQKYSPMKNYQEEMEAMKIELEEKRSSLKVYQQTQMEHSRLKEKHEKADLVKKKLETRIKKLEENAAKQNEIVKQMKTEKKNLEKDLKKTQEKLEDLQNGYPKKELKKVLKHVQTQKSGVEEAVTNIDKKKIKVLLEEIWMCIEPISQSCQRQEGESYSEAVSKHQRKPRLSQNSKLLAWHTKPLEFVETPTLFPTPQILSNESNNFVSENIEDDQLNHGGNRTTDLIVQENFNKDSSESFEEQDDKKQEGLNENQEELNEMLLEIIAWTKPLPPLLSPIDFPSSFSQGVLFGEMSDSAEDDDSNDSNISNNENTIEKDEVKPLSIPICNKIIDPCKEHDYIAETESANSHIEKNDIRNTDTLPTADEQLFSNTSKQQITCEQSCDYIATKTVESGTDNSECVACEWNLSPSGHPMSLIVTSELSQSEMSSSSTEGDRETSTSLVENSRRKEEKNMAAIEHNSGSALATEEPMQITDEVSQCLEQASPLCVIESVVDKTDTIFTPPEWTDKTEQVVVQKEVEVQNSNSNCFTHDGLENEKQDLVNSTSSFTVELAFEITKEGPGIDGKTDTVASVDVNKFSYSNKAKPSSDVIPPNGQQGKPTVNTFLSAKCSMQELQMKALNSSESVNKSANYVGIEIKTVQQADNEAQHKHLPETAVKRENNFVTILETEVKDAAVTDSSLVSEQASEECFTSDQKPITQIPGFDNEENGPYCMADHTEASISLNETLQGSSQVNMFGEKNIHINLNDTQVIKCSSPEHKPDCLNLSDMPEKVANVESQEEAAAETAFALVRKVKRARHPQKKVSVTEETQDIRDFIEDVPELQDKVQKPDKDKEIMLHINDIEIGVGNLQETDILPDQDSTSEINSLQMNTIEVEIFQINCKAQEDLPSTSLEKTASPGKLLGNIAVKSEQVELKLDQLESRAVDRPAGGEEETVSVHIADSTFFASAEILVQVPSKEGNTEENLHQKQMLPKSVEKEDCSGKSDPHVTTEVSKKSLEVNSDTIFQAGRRKSFESQTDKSSFGMSGETLNSLAENQEVNDYKESKTAISTLSNVYIPRTDRPSANGYHASDDTKFSAGNHLSQKGTQKVLKSNLNKSHLRNISITAVPSNTRSSFHSDSQPYNAIQFESGQNDILELESFGESGHKTVDQTGSGKNSQSLAKSFPYISSSKADRQHRQKLKLSHRKSGVKSELTENVSSHLSPPVLACADTSSPTKHSPENINKVRSEMGPPLPPLLNPLEATPPRTLGFTPPVTLTSGRSSLPFALHDLVPPLHETPMPPLVSLLSEDPRWKLPLLITPSPSDTQNNRRTLSSPLQFCATTPKHAVPVPGRLPPSAASPSSSQENSVKILDTMYPELSAQARTLNILKGNIQLNRCGSREGQSVQGPASQITGFKAINSTSTAFVKTGSSTKTENSSNEHYETNSETQRSNTSLVGPHGKRVIANPSFPKSAKKLRLDSKPLGPELKVDILSSVYNTPTNPAVATTVCSAAKQHYPFSADDSTPSQTSHTCVSTEEATCDILKKVVESCFDILPVIQSHLHVGNFSKVPVMRDEEKEVVYQVIHAKKDSAEPLLKAILKKLKTEKTLLDNSHLHALCRLYIGICRQQGDLERARLLCYSILKEEFPESDKLTLFILTVWQDVFCHQGVINKAMQAVVRQRAKGEILNCLSAYLGWEKNPPLDVSHLLSSVLVALQHNHNMKFQADDRFGDNLCASTWEYIFAAELLCSHQKWTWTHDNIISKELWPIMDKWIKHQKGDAKVPAISDVTVAAVLRLIGRLGQLGFKEGSLSAVKNMTAVLNIFLQHANQEGVPWAVQLAAVYAVYDLAPSNPDGTLQALQTWRRAATTSIPPAATSCIAVVGSLCGQLS